MTTRRYMRVTKIAIMQVENGHNYWQARDAANNCDSEGSLEFEQQFELLDNRMNVIETDDGPIDKPDTDDRIQRLAWEALNAACYLIQSRVGQDDGGLAGAFFSSGETLAKFEEYIRTELLFKARRS